MKDHIGMDGSPALTDVASNDGSLSGHFCIQLDRYGSLPNALNSAIPANFARQHQKR